MKKRYIEPSVKAIAVKFENHIAVESQLGEGGDNTKQVYVGDYEGDGTGALSKEDVFGW